MVTEAKKPHVLLVEDSEDDAFLFTWRFEQSGMRCSIQHVLDGAAAIEVLSSASSSTPDKLPCIMFLDLKMPVMNGFEVLSWLRQQDFFSQIPVIVLSGSDLPSDKVRAQELGATEYLVKPVNVSDLQRFLRDICPAAPGVAPQKNP